MRDVHSRPTLADRANHFQIKVFLHPLFDVQYICALPYTGKTWHGAQGKTCHDVPTQRKSSPGSPGHSNKVGKVPRQTLKRDGISQAEQLPQTL